MVNLLLLEKAPSLREFTSFLSLSLSLFLVVKQHQVLFTDFLFLAKGISVHSCPFVSCFVTWDLSPVSVVIHFFLLRSHHFFGKGLFCYCSLTTHLLVLVSTYFFFGHPFGCILSFSLLHKSLGRRRKPPNIRQACQSRISRRLCFPDSGWQRIPVRLNNLTLSLSLSLSLFVLSSKWSEEKYQGKGRMREYKSSWASKSYTRNSCISSVLFFVSSVLHHNHLLITCVLSFFL